MVLDLIFGIIILGIAVFIAVRIVGSITVGIVLIAMVFVASYFILGSFPNLKSIPIIGQFLPEFSTTDQAIAVIKNVFFNIDIISVSRDVENNLLVTVANTGKLDVSGFKVFVDNKTVNIINNPKDPLKSKETTIIQTDWKNGFAIITVETKQAKAVYS